MDFFRSSLILIESGSLPSGRGSLTVEVLKHFEEGGESV
jgi:hypothetical protein